MIIQGLTVYAHCWSPDKTYGFGFVHSPVWRGEREKERKKVSSLELKVERKIWGERG